MPAKKEEKKTTKAPAAAKAAAPAAKKAPVKAVQPAAKKAKVEVAKKGDKKKAPAAAKKVVEKKKKLNQHQRIRLLIQRPAKSFRIGQSIPPRGRDLTRMMRWPKYIVMQRQKRILLTRLKCPPPINQFNHTLDKTTAVQLFKLLNKYRPQDKKEVRRRRLEAAKLIWKAKKADKAAKTADKTAKRTHLREALAALAAKKPVVVKTGLNHITNLVESAKAQLVVIAHDVDPIELVVWLPALCRKKHIPYVIVKGKSRLGQLVHKKTATVLALTNVRKEDRAELDSVIEVAKSQFNDNAALLKQWSDQKFGVKHRQAEAKKLRRIQKAEAMRKTNAQALFS